jgi:hypothetical protein
MRYVVEKAKINRFNTLMRRVFIIVSSVWATLIFRSMNARNLLWSNAVISAAAAACVLGSLALGGTGLSGPAKWAFALGVGSATWWAYTWQRHVKSTRPDGLRPDHLAWHRHHWPRIRLVALLLLPLASAPLLMTAGNLLATPSALLSTPIALLATCAAITVLYAGLPGERGIRQSLRRIPGIKMLWIAGAWATITALWPIWWASGMESGLPEGAVLLWGERFLVIAALTLPFDLRDRRWDPDGMRTWPQLLGPAGTRILGLAFLVAAGLLRWALQPALEWNALLGPAAMAIAVLAAREDRPLSYYGLLDALIIADAAFLLLV